ncbi:MAG: DUF2891 domain-containing protein [Halobacteriota archaeon]
MQAFDRVAADRLVSGRGDWLGPAELRLLTEHPLSCIDREFPHYQGSIDDPEHVVQPSARHPIFYGCFDWHSAVHSHWSLLRQRRLFPDHPEGDRIDDAMRAHFTPAAVEGEVAYLASHPTFERPYGWGWLLRLVTELHLGEGTRWRTWRETVRPLEEQVVELAEEHVLRSSSPRRVGTHGNTAFALGCILDYATTVGRRELEDAAASAARRMFLDDTDYHLEYEPYGWDFLSPSLLEAEIMARVLEGDRFVTWFEGFLPGLAGGDVASLAEPISVERGTTDGMQLHLVGLNLSRAWSLAAIGDVLEDHPAAPSLRASARRHAMAGIDRAFVDTYAGSHWLTSFALYLLTRSDGGLGPELAP